MEIGEKIKQARLQAGLSQTQVAGADMTRAHISQIESGKSQPSLKTLKIIASRVGRPVDYFLKEDEYGDNVPALLNRAENAMKNKLYEVAIQALKEALDYTACIPDSNQSGIIFMRMGYAQYNLGHLSHALDSFQDAIKTGHLSRDQFIDSNFQIAHCYIKQGEYRKAINSYEKVIKQSYGLKSHISKNGYALLYTGSCYILLGKLEEALKFYVKAYEISKYVIETALRMDSLIGIGICQTRLGYTVQSLETFETVLREHKSEDSIHYGAKHNLAISLSSCGKWDSAYAIWQECLAFYKKNGDLLNESAILEEIGRYWIEKKDYDQAESYFHATLSILNETTNRVMSGRIYRYLARIKTVCEAPKVIIDGYYRLSTDIFKSANATDEVKSTCLEWKHVSNSHI